MSRAIIRKQNPIVSRLVEIGRCYKGSPKGTSKRGYAGGDDYASHYFRLEPEQRLKLHPATSDRFANLYDELKAAWEEMISQGGIKIRFPHSTIEENFPYSNRLIKQIGGTAKTFRECDGQTCTKWVEDEPHPSRKGQTIPKFKRGAIPCAAADGKECPMGCQAQGMLKFMVPDLYPGGVVLFPMNSPVDISAIAGYLEPYRQYDLSAIPFNLFRREDTISYDDRGEIKQKKNWGLHLTIDPTITRLMLLSKERQFLAGLNGDLMAPVISPASAAAALPASKSQLPGFRGSDDAFNFTARVQESIRACSTEMLNRAIEDARDLIHSNLYDRSGHEFIDREQERAMHLIRESSPYKAAEKAEGPAISVEAVVAAEPSEFVEGEELKALVAIAKENGWNSDSLKIRLNEIGINGSKKIPRDRLSEVSLIVGKTAIDGSDVNPAIPF